VSSFRGQLLVAGPALVDPNFRRTVVLLAEHNEEGAMGIVLNRPSETLVSEAVPPLSPVVGDDAVVYVGGPVEPSAVVVLADFEEPERAGTLVVGSVGFVVAGAEREIGEADVRSARVYAGYAGWSAGQLEAELEEQAWFAEPARAEDAFGDPDTLWSDVLRRKGGEYSVIALMPDDPSVN
jgi:putative transcriptional regulator